MARKTKFMPCAGILNFLYLSFSCHSPHSCQELRGDNDSLVEGRGRLEEQLSNSQRRVQGLLDDNVRLQMALDNVCLVNT